MKTLLTTMLAAGLLALAGCAAGNNAAPDNRPTANGAGSVPTRDSINAPNTNSGAQNAPEKSFDVPAGRPVENGKPQTVGGITVTIPADWKKLDRKESWAKFESPGKIQLYVQRQYDLQERDLLAEFARLRRENPDYQAMTRMIDGELGILYLAENDKISNGDVLHWSTFPPPDARGYAVKRSVMLICPPGTFEQNKQAMYDVLLSTKLQK